MREAHDGGPKASAIATAIARHQAANQAAQAAYKSGPGDVAANEAASSFCGAEFDALDELVETPCASDAEFVEKLKCLIEREMHLFGSPFESRVNFISVARAAALHFGTVK